MTDPRHPADERSRDDEMVELPSWARRSGAPTRRREKRPTLSDHLRARGVDPHTTIDVTDLDRLRPRD